LRRLRVFAIKRGFRRRKPCIFFPEKVDGVLLDKQPRQWGILEDWTHNPWRLVWILWGLS
jgi:hypothetical protein